MQRHWKVGRRIKRLEILSWFEKEGKDMKKREEPIQKEEETTGERRHSREKPPPYAEHQGLQT